MFCLRVREYAKCHGEGELVTVVGFLGFDFVYYFFFF